MPIYDYSCNKCGSKFELLIRGERVAACPECKSEDLEKLLSLPAIRSETTHGLAMRAAKKRDAVQGNDRVRAQREYELSHDD